VRQFLRLFRREPLILELSESDSLRLQGILDPAAENSRASHSRSVTLVTAIALLFAALAAASTLMLWR
jgi:hypothetical protein